MSFGNSTFSYGTLSKTFHWLTALLIITLIPLGIVANKLPYDTAEQLAQKAFLFSLHKTLGITTFAVAIARILWAIGQPKPGPLHPDRKLEHWLAETIHWLLYGSLVLVPLTGWIHHAATQGFAPIWWPLGQNLPFVPKDEAVASLFAGLHIVFERVLMVSVILHIAGAFKHHIIDKDVTLLRMWFGQRNLPDVKPAKRASLPVISALTAWCVALGIGGMLGLYESHSQTQAGPELAEVTSDWTVQSGDISITIMQFGSEVTGTFADWTAQIDFDPDIPNGKAGAVNVTISIPSLTIGSVTAQALGPDYFDAATHATAAYSGDIFTTPDGYIAKGTLTLRGNSLPVDLLFSPILEGDTATVKTRTTLQRLDFDIGTNMTDESSLGFDVKVLINLTAHRQSQDPT